MVGAVQAGGGLVAWRTYDGAMTGVRFLTFGFDTLAPALFEGDVVVMDNLSAHKTKAVREALAEAGVGVLYLPRYSLEFNSIQLCWAQVKARLRSVGARTRDALRPAVASSLEAVGAEQVGQWVRHCGYRLSIT